LFLLASLVAAGGLGLFLARRRRADDDEPSAGAFEFVVAGAGAGAGLTMPIPMPMSPAMTTPPKTRKPAAPSKASTRTSTGKTSTKTSTAAAGPAKKGSKGASARTNDPAALPEPATVAAVPDDPGTIADATSWEVSDDAPLAATSAAYAATRAAVTETLTTQTFDKPPARGVERATIRSRLVRLSSEADDVRSIEIGRLDRGDEVEIVDSFEGFLYVRRPDGALGWIRRATIV